MEAPKHFDKCDLCKRSYQQKPHVYEVSRLSHYDMNICNNCRKANWDGIGPMLENNFIEHLQLKNIPPPTRNAKGWYPLEPK
jgi:hypothetical protein